MNTDRIDLSFWIQVKTFICCHVLRVPVSITRYIKECLLPDGFLLVERSIKVVSSLVSL